jgi:hypothetical protein
VTALAATSECHIIRDIANTQGLDLTAGGSFSAENVEAALDKNAKLTADNADLVSRCIQLTPTDATIDMTLPASVVNTGYLYFTAGVMSVIDSVTPGTATVSVYGATLIDTANATAARAILEAVIGTNVQAYDAGLDDLSGLAVTNGNFIVGDGTNWVAESGATALTSLGAAADADVAKIDGSVAYTGTGVGFRDEDDMLSNDATAPTSQQSVRAFLYSVVGYDAAPVMYNDELVTYTA